MAGGDSQNRIVGATKFRVAGSKPYQARNWYSTTTRHVSQAQVVLNVAQASAGRGEKFWIEKFENNKWVKL